MLSVREEDSVRLAVDQACDEWDRAMDAWDAVTWALARDPEVGIPLSESGDIRAFVFDGARTISLPSLDVIYEYDRQYVTIKEAHFYAANNHFSGNG